MRSSPYCLVMRFACVLYSSKEKFFWFWFIPYQSRQSLHRVYQQWPPNAYHHGISSPYGTTSQPASIVTTSSQDSTLAMDHLRPPVCNWASCSSTTLKLYLVHPEWVPLTAVLELRMILAEITINCIYCCWGCCCWLCCSVPLPSPTSSFPTYGYTYSCMYLA